VIRLNRDTGNAWKKVEERCERWFTFASIVAVYI